MEKIMNLQLLAEVNTNVTTDPGLSAENKTFYDMALIQEASPNLIHDQFAQKHPIPKNGGKVIEFRKFAPLTKALTPLTEGVTPEGKSLDDLFDSLFLNSGSFFSLFAGGAAQHLLGPGNDLVTVGSGNIDSADNGSGGSQDLHNDGKSFHFS